MPNYNPTTGTPYGVIALNSLNGDTAHELMYGRQAVDLTYASALIVLENELQNEADEIEEEAQIGLAESDPSLVGSEHHEGLAIERAYKAKNATDREDWIERELETRQEPVIEGAYEGVQYRIDWLGGSPHLWVLQSPHTGHFAPCSPCIPGAGDLNTPDPEGQLAYCPPPDWFQTEE